jgi:hypothetical protein
MTLAALPCVVKGCLAWLMPRPVMQWLARAAPKAACTAVLLLSLSRSAALALNYGAPLRLYRQLPQVPTTSRPATCSQRHVFSSWPGFVASCMPHV